MPLYHISDSLNLGDELNNDHRKLRFFVEPFILALERSEDCLYAMLQTSKYLAVVLVRNGIRDWLAEAKWATEAVFEYVREREFPDHVSRCWCSYFYDDLNFCKLLYEYDWADADEQIRQRVRLYEVATNPQRLAKRDMRLYDKAYQAMRREDDIETAFRCARAYFAGEASEDPVWEYLSDAPAKAVRDVTELLELEK